MLLKDSARKAATVIIKRMKGGDSYESLKESNESMSQNGEEKSYDVGLDAAANEIMTAISMKSPERLKSALRSFYQMCQDCDEQED